MNLQNKSIPITAIILTNRNDSRFHAALASVQSCQEILVIDNNSQNDWEKLHQQFHFTKIATAPHPITDFAAARNDTLQFANQEWVLFLDSDEVLENPQNLRELLSNIDTTTSGFTVTRQDAFLGTKLKHGEAGKQHITRICKKSNTTFVGAVHEVAKIDGVVQKSQIVLSHDSHQSIAAFIVDITTYTDTLTNRKPKWNNQKLLQMVCYPPLKFIYNYLLKLGFLDGYPGLVYALLMSMHSFWVRVHTYEKSTTN